MIGSGQGHEARVLLANHAQRCRGKDPEGMDILGPLSHADRKGEGSGTPTEPHHTPFPEAQEEEIGRLKEQGQVLEDREAVSTKESREDAPIKGRSNNEEEAAAERISNDSEEIAMVLTSMDAATVLAGETNVPTGSGFIPTVGPPVTVISTGSEVGPTVSPIVTRRKGKEVMVDSDTLKKKKLQEQIDAQVARELEEQQEREDMRMNEQIARDAKVARIYAEEEIQGMIDSLDKSNETIARYLQEYQQFASELPLEKKIELISDLVKYQEHYTKCKLLTVASLIFWQWEQPSLAVGTYTASGNSLLAVGMPCAFYSQQSSPKFDAPSAIKFCRIK
nr:hypothetical protein [Tanacetum cinerariifolium]